VLDAKLAWSPKESALIQVTEYSLQVGRLQGRDPEYMHLALGDGSLSSHAVDTYADEHRVARRRLEEVVGARLVDTYPEPVEHCGVCAWNDTCIARRRADDHLCFVAGMRRSHRQQLVEAGSGRSRRSPRCRLRRSRAWTRRCSAGSVARRVCRSASGRPGGRIGK